MDRPAADGKKKKLKKLLDGNRRIGESRAAMNLKHANAAITVKLAAAAKVQDESEAAVRLAVAEAYPVGALLRCRQSNRMVTARVTGHNGTSPWSVFADDVYTGKFITINVRPDAGSEVKLHKLPTP